MSKFFHAIAATAAALAVPMTLAVPAFAQEVELTPTGHYSVTATKVGALLDDPAAAAILEEIIPVVYANEMFQTMGRDQTLEGIQQYEPVALSNENLARIQAEFDKLPPRE